MPINAPNPQIPLSALGAQSPPLDVAGTIYRSQAAHAMQAEAQRKQAEAQKQQQIDALASQYEDPEDYIEAVSRIDPLAARKFGEQFEKHKNEKLEGVKREYEAYGKKLDYYMRTLPDDPDDYALWRQAIVARSPDYEPMLPTADRWAADPAVRQQVRMMGMTAAEHVKHKQDVIDKFLKGDYRKGLLEAVGTAPTLDVARGYIEEARGFAPKADIAYVNGILASAPDFETGRQQALIASRSGTFQHVTIDENGVPTIGAFDPKSGDVMSTGARTTTPSAGQGSDYAQFLATFARERGKTPQTLTAAENLQARKLFGQADDKPTGGGADDMTPRPGDAALVTSVLKMPGLYAGLPAATKQRLLPSLIEQGFTGAGDTGKPSTGLQKKALGYFNRAKQASDEIDQLNIQGMSTFGQAWMNNMPNAMQSQLGQSFNAARRAFTESRLRKDSGAAIPQNEYDEDQRTYFPAAGDTDQTLAQKKRARATVLASIAFEAGPAMREFYGDESESLMAGYKDALKIPGGGGAPVPGAQAPAAVKTALAPKGPGRYTLSDGTTWDKFADGSIVKAQ